MLVVYAEAVEEVGVGVVVGLEAKDDSVSMTQKLQALILEGLRTLVFLSLDLKRADFVVMGQSGRYLFECFAPVVI